MATAACLPIAADRAGPCVRNIFFDGLDLTGVELRLEVRLNPETPGPAAIALGLGATANAEGLRLAGVTFANGVPTSQVTLRINEATMKDASKVPYSGELGDVSTMVYDLIGIFGQDKRRLCYGTLIALPTTYGMDAAPADRVDSYRSTYGSAPTWNSATLTFNNDDVRIQIDGADLILPAVARAEAAAAQSSALGPNALLRTGVAVAALPVQEIGSTAPTSGNGLPKSFAYGLNIPAPQAGQVTQVSIRRNGPMTGKLVFTDANGKARCEASFAVADTGDGPTTVVLATPLAVEQGDFAHVITLTGNHPFYQVNGGGRAFPISEYAGPGDVVPYTMVDQTLALSYTLNMVGRSLASRIGDIEPQVAQDGAPVTRDAMYSTNFFDPGGGFTGWGIRQDAGYDLPVGMQVDRIDLPAFPADVAAFLGWRIIRRPLSSPDIGSPSPSTTDEVLRSGISPLADVGLSANTRGRAIIRIGEVIAIEAGYAYYVFVSAFTAARNLTAMGVTSMPSTETEPQRRGMYAQGVTGYQPTSTIGAGSKLGIRLRGRVAALTATYDWRVAEASAVTSGRAVTVRGVLARSGMMLPFTATKTLDAAATYTRYDVLALNIEDLTISVLKGAEAQYDAGERIPVVTDGRMVALFNCRTTPVAATPVAIWAIEDGVHRDVAVQIETDRRLFRRAIPRTRAAIAAGKPLRFMSLGDSIGALDGPVGGAQSATAPNGANRDRARRYLTDEGGTSPIHMSADLANGLPVYTAVQIGRADDGAGSVHTKFGAIWEMVKAIEARGLHTLGTNLWYDNFCIGGKSSNDLWSNGAPTAWLNAAVAYAQANSVTAVLLHMAMNDTTPSVPTRTNMVGIIKAFRAIGVEVIVQGAWRARNVGIAANWDNVSNQVREAAIEAGAAFNSLRPILLDSYIGAVGISPEDLTPSNGENHPGIAEHAAAGRLLSRLVVE